MPHATKSRNNLQPVSDLIHTMLRQLVRSHKDFVGSTGKHKRSKNGHVHFESRHAPLDIWPYDTFVRSRLSSDLVLTLYSPITFFTMKLNENPSFNLKNTLMNTINSINTASVPGYRPLAMLPKKTSHVHPLLLLRPQHREIAVVPSRALKHPHTALVSFLTCA